MLNGKYIYRVYENRYVNVNKHIYIVVQKSVRPSLESILPILIS